jgi:phage gp46-like protein
MGLMSNDVDIKLINVSDSVDLVGYYDIEIAADGDVSKEQGFDTNIIMSLFCERRATREEVLEPLLRRGWWGNTNADEEGFEIGSKLWLLEQAKLTIGNVNLAQQYAQDSLNWLVTDDFIDSVNVTSTPTYSSNTPNISIRVDLIRKDNKTEYKYFDVWEETGE